MVIKPKQIIGTSGKIKSQSKLKNKFLIFGKEIFINY